MDHSVGDEATRRPGEDEPSLGDEATLGAGASGQSGELRPGERIDVYRVIRLLGRGGMGEVYEVEHETLRTRHALKIIPRELARRPGFVERFEREARVMATLEHPGIVHVRDFRVTDGRYWLQMDLVKGVSVGEGLARAVSLGDLAAASGGRLGQALFANLLGQILDALAYAHAKGAVHRDLKPSNILLDEGEGGPEARISDFGLVRIVGEDWLRSAAQRSVSRSVGAAPTGGPKSGESTRSLLGTYAYMSPEQKTGGEVDARSDLYAIGLMTARLLTGEAELGYDLPSDYVPHLAPGWDDFVRKAVSGSPDRRYQTAAEMREAVVVIAEEVSRALAEDTPPAESPPAEEPVRVESKPELTEKRKRGILAPLAVAVVVLLVIAGVFFAVARSGGDSSPSRPEPRPTPSGPTAAEKARGDAERKRRQEVAAAKRDFVKWMGQGRTSEEAKQCDAAKRCYERAQTYAAKAGAGERREAADAISRCDRELARIERERRRRAGPDRFTRALIVAQAEVLDLLRRFGWAHPQVKLARSRLQALKDAEKEVSDLAKRFGPAHPQVKVARANLDKQISATESSVDGRNLPETQDRQFAEALIAAQAEVLDLLPRFGEADPAVKVARSRLQDLEGAEKEVRNLAKRFGRAHPQMKPARARLNTAIRAIESRSRNAIAPAQPKLAIRVPFRNWTADRKRVKVITPGGKQWKETTYYKNTVGMEFVKVPPGEFLMGSENGSDDEKPVHRVRIARPFFMQAHEVTVGQMMSFLRATGREEGVGLAYKDCPIRKGDGGYVLSRNKFGSSENQPMVEVNWHGAQAFCRWLSQKERVPYRLPTEAEWEYACRAGTRTRFYSGDDDSTLGCTAWYLRNGDGRTHEVGGKLPNGYGLYDMNGNVREWCQSLYKSYPYSPGDGREDPSTGGRRVVRGGGWSNTGCSSAIRIGGVRVNIVSSCCGFRTAASSPLPQKSVRMGRTPSAGSKSSATRPKPKPAAPAPSAIPENWTSERKRVKVMTPKGEEWKEITYYRNPLDMEFVKVLAGEFMMGSPKGEKGRGNDEGPVHKVRIAKPFLMQAHEVTQRQWEQVMGSNPSHFKGANRPVEKVSWNDAQEFIKKLCAKENPAGAGYRLPTEAEWEYACRAGSTTRFYSGDEDTTLGCIAWYRDSRNRQTQEVGLKLPNAFGLYDMSGNVYEWCQDSYDSTYYGKSPPDALGPRSRWLRVRRGGGWCTSGEACRSADRTGLKSDLRVNFVGFRLARTSE